MAIPTFEYCSLQYLNQWLTYDRHYCQALSNSNNNNNDDDKKLTALKNAASFYRVARNLPSEFDVKKGLARYQPVLEILDTVNQNQFSNSNNNNNKPVKKILDIEKTISQKYGNRRVLSLTTKFLWLKIKQPIIIYDSQARIALELKTDDLQAYYNKWHKHFEKHKNQIKEACSKLPELHLYTADKEAGTPKYIKEITTKSWFHERVFDIFLWNKGNKA